MDVFLQKIASSMLFTSASAKKTKQQKPVLLASGSPRSQPVRSPQPEKPYRRIAHWDKKREKCANCKHIYLKTLSQHVGFCSVDCKSNMVYMEKVNRTIHAMKDAVQEQEQHRQKQSQVKEQQQQEPGHEDEHNQTSNNNDVLEDVETECKTFAEFGLESRILEIGKVDWAFSAMY